MRRKPTKRWTSREEAVLLENWRQRTMRNLRALLPGRTATGIYCHARRRGLPMRAPQGYVTLREASRRLGIAPPLLNRVLARYEVTVKRIEKDRPAPKRQHHCVDLDDAREALQRFDSETETPRGAAISRDMNPSTLRRWLVAAGIIEPAERKTHRRLLTADIDRVVSAHRSATGVPCQPP